jgi:hypothetical protein
MTRPANLRTLDADARIAFRELPLHVKTRRFLAGCAAKDRGPGLLVRTARPLPAGTVLEVALEHGEGEAPAVDYRGLAVVRWRTRLPGLRAMTLDFVDLEGERAFAGPLAAASCELSEALLPGLPAVAPWAAAAIQALFLPLPELVEADLVPAYARA